MKPGKQLLTEEKKLRTADKLDIGDVVVISGEVKFKDQVGEIDSFGRDKHFVVVKLYGDNGKHFFHSSDVTEENDEDAEEEINKFYVAFYQTDEERSWIGLVSREGGGKWHEKDFKGKSDHRWGQTYMSYLEPDQIMDWIYKDYGRHVEVDGPFFTSAEADDHVRQNWGPITEATKNIKEDSAEYSPKNKTYIGFIDKSGQLNIDHTGKTGQLVYTNKGQIGVIGNSGLLRSGGENLKTLEQCKLGDKVFVLDKVTENSSTPPLKIMNNIKEGFKKLDPNSQVQTSYDRKGFRVKTPDGNGIVTAERKEPTFSQLVPYKHFIYVRLDGGKTLSYEKAAVKFLKADDVSEAITYTDINDWKDAVKNSYPTYAKKIRFNGRMEGGKTTVAAEVPGLDRCFGVWDQDEDKGTVLSESTEQLEVVNKSYATGNIKKVFFSGTLDECKNFMQKHKSLQMNLIYKNTQNLVS